MDSLKNLFGGKKNKSEASSAEARQNKLLLKNLQKLNKDVKVNPDDFSFWQDRAEVLLKLGRTDEAAASLKRAAKLNAVMTMMKCNNLGNWLHQMGKHEEAIRIYKESIACFPDGAPEPLINLGGEYFEMNRYEDALQCFEKAALIAPGSGDSWNKKGMVLEKLGRLNEARTAYEEGARIGTRMAINNLERLKEKEAGHLPKRVDVLISGRLPDVNRQLIITELQQKAHMRGELAIKISENILRNQDISIECETINIAENLVSGLQSAGCHAEIRITECDEDKTTVVEKSEKHCPSCDWIVPEDAIRCIRCGARFVWK